MRIKHESLGNRKEAWLESEKRKYYMRSETLTGSRAHGRELRFDPQCSEKILKDFEAALWRIDSMLTEMEQKCLLGQLQQFG